MAQLFGELDFGIAREAGRGFYAGIDGLRSDLDHGDRSSRISRAKNKMCCENKQSLPSSGSVSGAQCKNSQQRGTDSGCRRKHRLRSNESTEGSPSCRLNDVDFRDLVVVEGQSACKIAVLVVGLFVAPHSIGEAAAIGVDAVVARRALERALGRRSGSLQAIRPNIAFGKVIAGRIAILVNPDHVARIGKDLPIDFDRHPLVEVLLHYFVFGVLLMPWGFAHICLLPGPVDA